MTIQEKIASFPDKRLLTILNQQHNYNAEYIGFVLEATKRRGLLGEEQVANLKHVKEQLDNTSQILFYLHSYLRRNKPLKFVLNDLNQRFNLTDDVLNAALRHLLVSAEAEMDNLQRKIVKAIAGGVLTLVGGFLLSLTFILFLPFSSFGYAFYCFSEYKKVKHLVEEIKQHLKDEDVVVVKSSVSIKSGKGLDV